MMQHTAATLQAACADIARSIGGESANVSIGVGYAYGRPILYVSINTGGTGLSELLNANDFDDALSKARATVEKWTAKANAADREYASWTQPVLMAAE